MKRFSLVCCWLLSISVAHSSSQSPIDFNFYFNGSNAVQIIWNAYPGKNYVLQTSTNLSKAWSNSPTLIASSNSLSYTFRAPPAALFNRRLHCSG
jgi:hypothetical protein